MKITIVSALYLSKQLHCEFTDKTVDSISSKEHLLNYIFVVNYVAPELEDYLHSLKDKLDAKGIDNEFIFNKENAVSKAWNIGIKKGLETYKSDFVLVVNNDIVCNPSTVDNLIKFAKEHSEAVMWTASEHGDVRTIKTAPEGTDFAEHPHFSCFLVDDRLFDLVGYFDENIRPAYTEDNDMHYRIKLAGEKALITTSSKFYHFGSRTIKSDSELEVENVATHGKNNVYYEEKWGGLPGKEVFTTPYMSKDKDWKYWRNQDVA